MHQPAPGMIDTTCDAQISNTYTLPALVANTQLVAPSRFRSRLLPYMTSFGLSVQKVTPPQGGCRPAPRHYNRLQR